MSMLRITYKKSVIGYNQAQRRTIQSLGLRKLHQTVIKPDTSTIRGMLFHVQHLVSVEEVGDEVKA